MNFDGLYPRDFECILVDKVFDSCLAKECFDDISVRLPDGVDPECCDLDIKFENGIIKHGSLKVIDIPDVLTDGCKRVKMTVIIKYVVSAVCHGKCYEIPGTLPEIPLDIVMYCPDTTRSEFKMNIIVETMGEVLDRIIETDYDDDCSKVRFVIGVYIIPKCIGKVQLRLNDVLDYCVPPRECKKFEEIEFSRCEDFKTSYSFPEDFYPPQSPYVPPCDEDDF